MSRDLLSFSCSSLTDGSISLGGFDNLIGLLSLVSNRLLLSLNLLCLVDDLELELSDATLLLGNLSLTILSDLGGLSLGFLDLLLLGRFILSLVGVLLLLLLHCLKLLLHGSDLVVNGLIGHRGSVGLVKDVGVDLGEVILGNEGVNLGVLEPMYNTSGT